MCWFQNQALISYTSYHTERSSNPSDYKLGMSRRCRIQRAESGYPGLKEINVVMFSASMDIALGFTSRSNYAGIQGFSAVCFHCVLDSNTLP